MANSAEEKFRKYQENIATALKEIPGIVANEAVSFSLEAMQNEAWSGNSQEDWQKRKNPTKWGKVDDGHKLLQQTMKLKRSIRVSEVDPEAGRSKIAAGGDNIAYARAHNEGVHKYITQKVKPYSYKRKDGTQIDIKAGFERTILQNIPKRQYIGGEKDSPYLKARLRRVSIARMMQARRDSGF